LSRSIVRLLSDAHGLNRNVLLALASFICVDKEWRGTCLATSGEGR